jgi:DivIVA domain-containing protein
MDMINASAAETHRFGRVRRNGYDPAEVDAVVSRLIETLRGYEARTEKLETRLNEADASADAIRRTFIVAEQTRDELLAEATREAEETIEAARREATAIDAEAKALGIEMAAERERIFAEAVARADEMLTAAEVSAAQRASTAAAAADALVEAATQEAAQQRHVAAEAQRASSIAGAWIMRTAHENASSIVADASAEATVILRQADRESEVLKLRVASLQAAVADLQAAAADLASLATNESSVIDLKAIEALSVAPEPMSEPTAGTIVEPMSEPTAGTMVEPLPEIESGVETDAPVPLLSVSQAREELDRESAESLEDDEDPGPPTYYQRTTGVPLSERIKIARTST